MDNKELSVFAERLRNLRNELGISQTEFVDGIGITASSLSAYEKNSKIPSIGVVKKIAEKYNVSIDWLCGLSEDKQINQEIKTYSDLFKMLRKINNVSENFCRFEGDFYEYSDTCKGAVIFNDRFMAEMLDDWDKMIRLYYGKSIDKEVLNLWEEKTINKYNFSIYHIDETITDDDYPMDNKEYHKAIGFICADYRRIKALKCGVN